MSANNGQLEPKPPSPWERYLPWLGWLLFAVASFVASWLGYTPPPIPPPPVFYAQGWVENPGEVDRVVAGLEVQNFADTPAGRAADELPKSVYLWDAYRKLHGKLPPSKNQGQVGSCVSFGTNTAVERTIAADIAFAKRRATFKFLCEEATYGGSRVEVGGGRLRGDGSVGAWAADFVRRWGVLPREVVGGLDLGTYSESRCREWGSRGVPDDLEPLAKEHPVQETTLVKSWVDAKKALANGYGIAICSNQGFSMQRDARGVAKAQGSWAHCMCLDGYHVDGGSEYGHIENSWGADAHKGPLGWGEPPPSGFWAESAVIDRMLRQGDSWAFSAVKGWPARVKELDWYVRLPAPRWREAVDEPLWALAP